LFVRDEAESQKAVTAIQNLSAVSEVFVVNQGFRLPEIRSGEGRVEVVYTEKPVGIWGAVQMAWESIVPDTDLPGYEMVALNLAPFYFGPDHIEKLRAQLSGFVHVVGLREDIASSLDPDPTIGRMRALMECFLTCLAEMTLFSRCFQLLDGFSGLQGFTPSRFADCRWAWIEAQKGKQPWGGALQSQLQSLEDGYIVEYVLIPHGTQRTWSSTLGTNTNAVFQMLDKARQLPVFNHPDVRNNLDQAVWLTPEVYYRFQPWMQVRTKQETCAEIKQILEEYNKTSMTPFLIG